MKLTKKNKKYIDDLPYEKLFKHWMFSMFGDPWFEGETKKYWYKRMRELKEDKKNFPKIKQTTH